MIDKCKSKFKTLIRELAYSMPLKNYFWSLRLPIGLTIVFTTMAYFLVIRNFPRTIAFSVVFLFITLLIQDLLQRSLFDFKLKSFITKTKNTRKETKALGSKLLAKFMNGKLPEGTLRKGDNLSLMLTELEQEKGYPLEQNSYDFLLRELTSKGPIKLLAVWNFEVVPMNRVYKNDGKLIDGESLFDKLSNAYMSIKNEEDKQRVFIFKNNDRKRDVMSHNGWATLCEFHKKNKCSMFLCSEDTLQHVRNRDDLASGVMDDDFVYYAFKKEKPCVIGIKRKKDLESKRNVSLLSSGEICDYTLKLYRRLVQSSEPFPQRDV